MYVFVCVCMRGGGVLWLALLVPNLVFVSISVFDLCFLLSVGFLFVSNLVYFSTFLYYLCLCCDCNKCIYPSYTHSINIYINIYMNQPIWSVFVNGVPVHNRFCFVLITWKAVKSWPFDWKWKLLVLACVLSWGLNVNHWLGAVIFSLLAVFLLLWTHVLDQGLFSLPFFDPRCTSICSFIKVLRVLFFIYHLKRSGKCSKEVMFSGRVLFLHWDVWFCLSSCWYSSVQDDFQELCRLKCVAFCFRSVAKCLLNTVCEQQWIKKGPLFLKKG